MPVHKLIKALFPKSKSFDALAVAGWKLVNHKYYLFLSSWDAWGHVTRHAQKKLNYSTSFMTFVEDLSVIHDPRCN